MKLISESVRETAGKTASAETVLRVALPVAVARCFDYRAPGAGPDWIGCRVLVPFGRRRLVGVVVDCGPPEVPEQRLQSVLRRLDAGPLLDATLRDDLAWLAAYHHHPLGEVLATALPPPVRTPSAPPPGARLALTPEGRAQAPRVRGARLSALLRLLGELGPLPPEALDRALPGWKAILARHRDRGWLRWEGEEPVVPEPVLLNPDQERARAAVREAFGRFQPFLLAGVTGSGKTEVYLALAAELAAAGRQSLVLVPEIALVPQTLERFRRRLGPRVAALHSGLPAGERARVWAEARSGALLAIVGTRSAVFAPLPRPGLIVVDEEHDLAYRQGEGLRYSARDFALVRARGLGIPVLLGSATPSLESLALVRRGRLVELRLPRPAVADRPPVVRVADVAGRPPPGGIAAEILAAIGAALGRGEQALVFRNRRGYAPLLLCRGCGFRAECGRCGIALTCHRAEGTLLVCHGCGAREAAPARCPRCGGAVRLSGFGTERLEETLAARFPGFPVVRVDRDSARRRGALERLLAPARRGEPCILVGTQMLAKGHDLPRLTVVAALHVDAALARADFRAAERFAQLLVQVRGRAGRAGERGEVWLQTVQPGHPLLRALLAEGYDAFAARELELRREAGLPPFAHQARLCAEGTGDRARAFLAAAREITAPEPGLRLDGPLPALAERRAGRLRFELLLEARTRAPLHRWLARAMPALRADPRGRRLRWFLEVDPQSADWE